jgi:hypothetical protein
MKVRCFHCLWGGSWRQPSWQPGHLFWGSRQRKKWLQRRVEARCPWLMPVILAAQGAEIRTIMVWSQPGQIVC